MEISQDIKEQLDRITQRAYPNEASALLFKDNTIVIEANPKEKSPVHFAEIDPLWLAELVDKYGNPTALFHSHPCTAYPSSIDHRYMFTTISFWNCVWLIMSSSHTLKAWTLDMDKQINGKDNINYMKFKEIKVEIV